MTRQSGVLAHITSLPGPHGIGTLGEDARLFARALSDAGQHYWQMLPVGPTGYRDSPYQSPSTFAGNPLLIDLNDLVADGLLHGPEIDQLTALPRDRVNFGELIPDKTRLLILAARRFLRRGGDDEYDGFRKTSWLDSYATFAAIKQSYGGRSWVEWERGLAMRNPGAIARASARLEGRIEVERAIQYLFHRQWEALVNHARSLGVALIGDLPIFVAHDSADVWSRPDLFHLGSDGRPSVVAGVPPDYFAATGQRWGNPLYDWDAHRAELYQWWADRLRATFARFDMVRIDHFRGFVAFWEIPASEPTAVNGHWVEGPGIELFTALQSRIGPMSIIAEDLGIITDEVTNLRQSFGYPGMRVAQFGFDEEIDTAIHHPDNYPTDVVAYTGTHDNDTTLGWFWGDNGRHDRRRLDRNRRRLLALTGSRGEEINWDLIKIVLASAAETAVVPVQDLLGLGIEARMNTPGQEEGNWIWRMTGRIGPELVERLGQATSAAER
ncbi:MAG TPA: 4-alpha-glucanotransferase [Acidimicrobiia bacterium]|nr:4-alpha-glucanotransferase [Acidimicrobiia bacterium]